MCYGTEEGWWRWGQLQQMSTHSWSPGEPTNGAFSFCPPELSPCKAEGIHQPWDVHRVTGGSPQKDSRRLSRP